VTSQNGFHSNAELARVSNRYRIITGQEVQLKVRTDNTTWVTELSEVRAKEQA
jgi:hypothetical protein